MKLTTKSEYALICLKYLCEHSNGKPVSVAEISREERLPRDYVEQIFVRLRRANLVKSVKGIRGGFMLARNAAEVTLLQIIEAVEGVTFEIFCAPRLRERNVCEHLEVCGVRPVWRKLKQLIDDFCAHLTLEMLLGAEGELEKKLEMLSFEKREPLYEEVLKSR